MKGATTAVDPTLPVVISCSAWAVRSVWDEIGGGDVVGVVSISDPGAESPLQAVVPRSRLLVLHFPDVSVSEDEYVVRWGGEPGDLFSAETAQRVLDFAESCRQEFLIRPRSGSVIVHCGQGISRSAAVTALLPAKWGLEPAEAIRESRTAHYRHRHLSLPRTWAPKRLVLGLGSQSLFGDDRLLDAYDAYVADADR
jgi:predicted protein tyrosine phosphatase